MRRKQEAGPGRSSSGPASFPLFTEVVMALAGSPRSHENEPPLEGYFHCENMGGERPPAGLTHIFTGLQEEECLAGDPSARPEASPPPDRDGRDFIEACTLRQKAHRSGVRLASALVNVERE
jgi:hypothetical protein